MLEHHDDADVHEFGPWDEAVDVKTAVDVENCEVVVAEFVAVEQMGYGDASDYQ